jgi:nifR3 family TIM-barrel protein
MKDPKKAGKILEAMVKAVDIPVTVKIRKGFDKDNINAVEMAKVAQDCGVAAVALHGRTREEYYTGKADWNIIKEVKETIKIPVIGSGDVFSPEDALRMQQETGVDGIMIARGARGNPWIFSRTAEYLKTGRLLPKPDIEEVKKMIMRHAEMEVEFKGEYTGIREMRKHVAWYTVGMPGSSALRRAVNEVESLDGLRELLYRQD